MAYVRWKYWLQWIEPMPRVPDIIMNSACSYPDSDDAQCGSEIGGSGFLLGWPSESGNPTALIATQ